MTVISRKKTRKFLYQKLFSESFNKNWTEKFLESFLIDSYKWNLDEKYLKEMFKIVKDKEYFSLYIIKKYSPKFELRNMDLASVLPIFIWVWEMFFYSEEIPAKVSINEAVEVSKTFWDDSSKKIVNWVLNKVMNDYKILEKKIDNISKKIDFSFFK